MHNELNSQGFRSDEFKKDHNGRLHAVYAGSGETYGTGGSLYDTWSHMLYNKLIKHSEVSGYFSLGKVGYDHNDIINSIKLYVEEYFPNVVFAVFPEIKSLLDSDLEKFLGNIVKLDIFLKSLNIKFYWSALTNEKFPTYFDLDLKIKTQIIKDSFGLSGYTNIAFEKNRMDHINHLLEMHPHFNTRKPDDSYGTVYHAYWSNRFDTRYVADLQQI
jgi:hypothetical protein